MSRLRPLVAGTLLGAAFLCSTAIAQQAPRTISYQGYATNASGGPVADGSYAMVFTIYNNANGGSALWSESQNVEVRKGLFGVVFGESTPLALPFDNPYWLGVRLQPSDPEMNPRTQFTASPYSIRSLMSDSAMAVAPNSVTTVSIAPGAVTLDKLDASGSRAGQVLTSTGSGLAWADPSTVTGVNTLNGLNGDVEIVGGPSTSVTVEGNKVKIGLLGGGAITSVNSADAAIGVTNGTGPSVTLSIVPGGISTPLITDEAVTTQKLAPGAVTQDKLAPGLTINPSGPAGGDLTGTYPNPTIAPDAVNSGKILDGSIQNADLANSSITINPGIGMSGGGPVPLGGSVTIDNAGVTGLVGTPNQVNVSAPNGVVTLSTPQDIDPGATPTFNNMNLSGKANSASTVSGDPGNTLVTKDYLVFGNIGVATNPSLVGDGTTGNPLGINLANPNTYTATQSLPATAAQGDNLIASVNAGTTTVDDAHVADNLTIVSGSITTTPITASPISGSTITASAISGSTISTSIISTSPIDNSPIGATTPNTGAFTSINGASLALTGKGTSASTVLADPGNTLVTKDYLVAGNIGVVTNPSLVGDGTTGNPLGINLANPNTFTATQTLPVSAAQGDALIASTNAGAATVNAVRIGNGLTDAQVNDDLTINGGSVDNSPIGATTPNTGAFTSIDGASLALTGKGTSASTVAADPGNTLLTKDFVTTPGNVAVSTDPSLVGDGTTATPLGINLANPNTFTATQTLPVSAAQGDALIASTNAGTTTIDDAHVADNLTINGGTVDNSPIGATTPSTAAFTTIDGTSLALTAQGTSASTLVTDPGNTLLTKDFVTTPGNVAVSTDPSLVGDGTTATPLGINLANPNTFTATQTLPVSAAQGDALIASTNAGTATVDAVRIGNGLTDAQVNDDLTINGGSVDNSPIGATTPSTGAFTSIDGASLALTAQGTSASTLVTDPGNTLVTKDYLVAGNLAVSTDATLVGDGTTATPLGLNTANANTFTATQTLPVSAAQGDNLIASANAGTTTIDDAHVADNLTINGGTVDNSPIGATTPNTGAFTSIDGASLALTAQGTSASTLVTDPGNTLVTKDYLVAGNLAVSTDVTLVGDGTTATPLGLNTANANTFTATQTLPVSAAQGDNLIASANAGTTTIDDAHVADNLTINGGTVDNSPIGATTPNTGAFTSIDGASLALTAKGTSASTLVADAGNTLVTKDYLVAGNLAVSTDATLVGDGTTATPLGLNTANANTFTATQTLPVSAAQGDNLIASANAGTTTIDDAHVADNLTINGGTVDNSPIGATTPNTGAFTSIDGASLALTAQGTSASTLVTDPGNTLVTKDYLVAGNLAVSTDATLVGDGTTATPLGLNTANANTFTATQTLPVSAAQGDNLIASANAGTTTIDDAHVADNLTINGGTVDNSPIGATTPNTGAFTSIDGASLALTAKGTSASTLVADAGNTLVTKDYLVAGNLAVSTDATLVGDGTTATPLGLNTANANTFTATQTLPVSAAQGDNLIASANAGTTTIDDAHVADNLTVNGGTVDNSPIGATTPSTGAFTSIGGTSLALTAKGTSASTTAGDGGTTLVTKDYLVAGNLAVSTDVTLVGDGTTATPLGINLANPNTFTATQTLPATNAQGDALITSVNAGSTTINASQIGNGLTDAQVLNNLTISAGTVNNTPIGATTPSTGAFTTIGGTSLALTAKGTSASTTAGDGGTTLVTKDYLVAGNLAVSTDATLVGDGTTATPLGINLANPNTFTATQTLPATNAQGDALITSVNAGSTTINASQIGNGLTDAQVLNNLTISAGTVNNTPIGATTPSTGAFTTINGTSLALTAKGTSASTTAGDGGTTLVTKDYLVAGNLAVSTDATMTGNGTTATPLGINLANPNTFTATQTLPATNAQGDALITSVNAGSTTINASQIGNGLTDAQVLNNLTISAGTVNNTPIGATTPSTGAFTTINGTSLALTAKATSASTAVGDGGTTLVTKDYLSSGNLAVTTDATLTGNGTTLTPLGINTANANTFTATQTLPTSNAQGDALIASTNSGTTTINASRIGTGLTDAQVNNNLTIAAGTINSTPIGATTPSTGAFTAINGTSLTLTAKATSAATTAGDGATTLVTKGYVETAGNVAVMTDATLSGDGTSALPLGVNVANANSWSATQTFPTSNAQGDALIASTNSGTTAILATRIGNGLTDAQVLNNLTISGGTVNNSPIGATTPSTGVFEYASTADENAAVRGNATQATANQSIGVWGDASSAGATNTGTIAVLATGNGNATAGQTNVAIQINDGEFAIGRSSTAPSAGTVVEAAAGGTAYSSAGPSGVIELTLGGGNLTTAAPTAGTFQDLGTLTVNNRYVTTESIIHVTVVSKVDEGTAPNPESAVYMVDVDNRAAGSFVLRIGMIPTVSNGSDYQNTDAIRVGYTVVNPSK